jgi:hypothetical protein
MIGTTRQKPKILAPNWLQILLNRSNDWRGWAHHFTGTVNFLPKRLV